jgi:hypothetical protein
VKTVVYQSYRTTEVPDWLNRCMKSVRSWADLSSFDYQFIDDRLLTYVPDWYRAKARNDICPVADLARLNLAKEFLNQGYDQTIWVDADALIFAPSQFAPALEEDYAFCQEVWVVPGPNGHPTGSDRVNNSVTIFKKGNAFLDFYIHACQFLAAGMSKLGTLDVGTTFLTDVGAISPFILVDIATGQEDYLQSYMRQIKSPLHAANLCSSFRNKTVGGILINDQLYEKAVDKCLKTKGECANRFFQRPEEKS